MRHSPLLPLASVHLLVFVAGCQENVLKHLDSAAPDPDPRLEVSPAVIDFGQGEAGEVRSDVFTLTSTGETAVNVAAVSVQGGSAFSVVSPGALALEPGDSVDVVVSWTPLTYDDHAQVEIDSDALTPQLQVDLYGQGLYPGIELDPASMSFVSDYGESEQQDLTIRSVGTADLVVSQSLLVGASFEIDLGASGGVFTLPPGESITFPVTYTPPSEGDTSTGDVWLSTNTADPSVVVPLYGTTEVPCYGLGEAWDRGVLQVVASFTSQLVLENTGTEVPICVDQWYVFLSDTSQDAIAGDPGFDLSDDYPYGSVTIEPGSSASFNYARSDDDAWWCMEHAQNTQRNADYTFFGARAPDPLLDRALVSDQDGIWSRQESRPVIAIGRTVNYVELALGGSAAGGIDVMNIGESDSPSTVVTETLPPGFSASGFSVEPDTTGTSADGGAMYTWTLALDGRIVSSSGGDTTYDEARITWTLSRSGDCAPRVNAPEALAGWSDADGTHVSSANPLVIACL